MVVKSIDGGLASWSVGSLGGWWVGRRVVAHQWPEGTVVRGRRHRIINTSQHTAMSSLQKTLVENQLVRAAPTTASARTQLSGHYCLGSVIDSRAL